MELSHAEKQPWNTSSLWEDTATGIVLVVKTKPALGSCTVQLQYTDSNANAVVSPVLPWNSKKFQHHELKFRQLLKETTNE